MVEYICANNVSGGFILRWIEQNSNLQQTFLDDDNVDDDDDGDDDVDD